MGSTTTSPSEAQIQSALLEWMKLKYPEAYEMTAAVPNGGYRLTSEGVRLRRQGVKAGYPDLLIDLPVGDYPGMRMELKTERGHLTDEQKAWCRRLDKQGFYVVVAWGLDQAMGFVTRYLDETYQAANDSFHMRTGLD